MEWAFPSRRWKGAGFLLCFILGSLVVAGTAVAQAPSSTGTTAGGASADTHPITNQNAPQGTPQASLEAQPGAPGTGTTSSAITNALPALPVSLWSRAGVKVAGIRFEGVTIDPHDTLLTQLTQTAGEPLDPEKVRADLRRLFASGRYRDIQVNGEAAADGSLTLVYAGTPRDYVGRVTILGVKEERLSSLLEFATNLEPGTAYTESQIPAAFDNLKQTLAQNGYYQPILSLAMHHDVVGHQQDVTFNVAVGPRAKIGELTLEGADAGLDVATFRKQGDLNCSRLVLLLSKHCRPKVERETVSNALSGVRSFYEKHDRLEGTISLQKSVYVETRKQLDYDFSANQGPVVHVVINGVKLAKARVKLLVPVYEEGAVDNDLLNEGAFNIRDYLQQKGYFDVEDKVQLLGAGTRQVTVQYDVVPGQQHRVTAVSIKGNKYFSSELLGDTLRVKKGDAYQRSGRYSTQLVSADASSIEALYRANGFSNVKVTSAVKDIDKGPNGAPLKLARIEVTFTVVEGTQQKFGAVSLEGVNTERFSTVHALLSAQTGQPFSLLTLSQDRDAVLSFYLSHGFDHAKVEIQQTVEKQDASRTDVGLNVTEGQQVFIDHVLLSGIYHTRPSLVKAQLLVHAGDPLDQAALLQTQRNLYNLALFNEVNAAVQNPTGDAPYKNVLVQLTEAKRWDVTYGFGFEAQTGTPGVVPGQTRGSTAAQNGRAGVSPRVSIDVSRINFRGTQQSLTLHATYGLLEKVATLSFNNPQLFGHPNLTGQVSGGYSNVQNISTFSSSTLQGDFRVTQKVKRADTFIYDFQYRRVSVDASSLEITPNLIPQLSEPVRVAGPALTYFHDTRDPSPLNAGKGQYFSVSEFFSSSKFGSQVDFNKLDITQSTYYTFGKKKYVFARNLRVGFENAFGTNPNATGSSTQIGLNNCAGSLINTNPDCNAVPLPERLYAGGATSHRGFGINDAGPRDLTTGYPVGGSGVVVNSFELRLPPPTLPVVGDSISFVIFHDMGNVFEHPGDMFSSIKNFRQPNEATCRNITIPAGTAGSTPTEQRENAVGTCNFNYYSHAVGLGARYNTPVGPIRVDFSYNLNPPVYPVFYDYTSPAPYVGQAGHFNFFFSIGQSF